MPTNDVESVLLLMVGLSTHRPHTGPWFCPWHPAHCRNQPFCSRLDYLHSWATEWEIINVCCKSLSFGITGENWYIALTHQYCNLIHQPGFLWLKDTTSNTTDTAELSQPHGRGILALMTGDQILKLKVLLVEFNVSDFKTVLWVPCFLKTASKSILKERPTFCLASTGPLVLNIGLLFQESFTSKKAHLKINFYKEVNIINLVQLHWVVLSQDPEKLRGLVQVLVSRSQRQGTQTLFIHLTQGFASYNFLRLNLEDNSSFWNSKGLAPYELTSDLASVVWCFLI